MPLSIPPELKRISPYIKRAEELDKDKTSPESRLVAYYCRQYAVQLGIPAAGTSPAAKACLAELLGDLEKEKPAMDNFTRDEAAFLCRKFAEGVFNKADAEDRAGKASKATAKVFYAAASFLQMLEQFTDDEEDESEQVAEDKKRIVYSKWKSTEILKAIKEGREPTPGGYGEDEEEEEEETPEAGVETALDGAPTVETVTEEEEDDGGGFGLPPAPKTVLQPFVPPQPPAPESEEEDDMQEDQENDVEDEGTEVSLGPPPAYPPPPAHDDKGSPPRVDRPTLTFDLPPVNPVPLPSPSKPKPSGGIFGALSGKKKGSTKAPNRAQMADAVELTKFALAALEDRNGDLGAERLQQALEALGR